MIEILKVMVITILVFGGIVSMILLSYLLVPFFIVSIIFTAVYLLIKINE